MLDVRDLIRIQAVLAHGGVSRAAAALGMTQPALTRSIAAAERVVGGLLFRRSRQGAEPTALCRMVLADAPEIIGRMQALHDRLGHLRGGSGEEVAIAAGPFPMEFCLAATVAFRRAYPRVRVRLETLPWPSALAQLRARLCELAVVTAGASFTDGAFEVEPLPPQRLVFVVAPGHALAKARRTSTQRVLDFPLVTTAHLSDRLQNALAMARGEVGGSRRADLPYPAVLAESPAAWLALTEDGEHVALTGLASAAEPLHRGKVVVVQLEAQWLASEPAIVHLSGRPPTFLALAFCAELRRANEAAVALAEQLWAELSGQADSSMRMLL